MINTIEKSWAASCVFLSGRRFSNILNNNTETIKYCRIRCQTYCYYFQVARPGTSGSREYNEIIIRFNVGANPRYRTLAFNIYTLAPDIITNTAAFSVALCFNSAARRGSEKKRNNCSRFARRSFVEPFDNCRSVDMSSMHTFRDFADPTTSVSLLRLDKSKTAADVVRKRQAAAFYLIRSHCRTRPLFLLVRQLD